MKYAQNYLVDKLQKNFSLSSLAWTVVITAIVLALAASASAQTDDATNDGSDNVPPAELDPAPLPEERPIEVMPEPAPTVERTEPRDLNTPVTTTTPNTETRNPDTRQVDTRTVDPRRAEIMSEIEARREAIANKRAELAERATARVAALREATQTRITNQAARLTGVLELAINRMQTTSTRLRGQAEAMSDRGVDTSTAVRMLNEADQLILDATTALEGIEVNVSYAATSETPREDWQEARAQYSSVTRILGEARGLLGQVIGELKRAIANTSPSPEVTEESQ